MSKYYTLLLNNYHKKGYHYISPEAFTMLPDILVRTYDELPPYKKETKDGPSLVEDFAELDDIITKYSDDLWVVYGSFPVIGTIIDGKMHDVITGMEIKDATKENVAGELSYSKKIIADEGMADLLLSLLSEDDIERYSKTLNRIVKKTKIRVLPSYRIANPITMSPDAVPLLIKGDGIYSGEYYDVVTKESIIPLFSADTITSKLSFYNVDDDYLKYNEAAEYSLDLLDIGKDKYIEYVKDAKTRAVREYNNFVRSNGKVYTRRKTSK